MNLDTVGKKQREARFFLDKMIDQESRAFGDKEPFDFYLSAFLSAARSVHWRLCHEQKSVYTAWRKVWDGRLDPAEAELVQFMVKDRNIEVHRSGSRRSVATEKIRIGNRYSDKSGTIEGNDPSLPLLASASPIAPEDWQSVVIKPAYNFAIAGTERKATEACREYLTLLGRMLANFKADHPKCWVDRRDIQ